MFYVFLTIAVVVLLFLVIVGPKVIKRHLLWKKYQPLIKQFETMMIDISRFMTLYNEFLPTFVESAEILTLSFQDKKPQTKSERKESVGY